MTTMRAIGVFAILLGGVAILACETYLPNDTTTMFVQGMIGLAVILAGVACIAWTKIDGRLKALETRLAKTHEWVRLLRPPAGEDDTKRVIEQLREAGLLKSEGGASDQEIDASMH
jgi:hypothetical protein